MRCHIPDFLFGYAAEPVPDEMFDSFADDLFGKMWHGNHICVESLPRARDYSHELNDESILDNVSYCVWVRRMLYGQTLFEACKAFSNISSKSTIDFYMFFENNVDSILPSEDLYIYDKLLMTCAFIIEMGKCCVSKNKNTHIYAAPLILSLYFDTHLRKDFYNEGGWKGLKYHTYKYTHCCQLSDFNITKSCSNNHNDLLNTTVLFETAHHDCDLRVVINAFIKMCGDHDNQDTLTCRRCLPLFLALRQSVLPQMEIYNKPRVIEGYLQFLLRMPSDEEIKDYFDLYKYKLNNARDTGIFDDDIYPAQGIPFKDSPEFFRLIRLYVRKANTETVIRNLLPDDLNTTEDSDCSSKIERCIFCTQSINWPELLPRTFAFEKNLEAVKETILSKINYVPEPAPDLGEFKDEKVEEACLEAFREKYNKFRDAKLESLRLFMSLGVAADEADEVMHKLNDAWFDVPALVRQYKDLEKGNPETSNPKKKSRRRKPKNKGSSTETSAQKDQETEAGAGKDDTAEAAD